MKKTIKRILGNAALLVAGSLIFALSLSLFLSPAGIVTGGVSGLSILLADFLPLGTGTLFLLLNLPILLAGLWKFGRRFMLSTLAATLLSSLFTDLLSLLVAPLLPLTNDPLLVAIFGGMACGAGLGLVFRADATTGGTDILVRLLRLKLPHFKPGALFFAIDSLIVLASAIVSRSIETGLYSTIALLLTSFVMDFVLYGRDRAKLLFIVSDRPAVIASRLLSELEVGVTYIDAAGAYTKSEKTMLFCAVKNRLFPRLRKIVAETDENAFLVVGNANEIFGEGFKPHSG